MKYNAQTNNSTSFSRLLCFRFPETDAEKQESSRDKKRQRKQQRGHKRWLGLPEPIDVRR